MVTLESCPGLEVKFKVIKSTNKHGTGFRPIEDVVRSKNETTGFVQVTEEDEFLIRVETHATKLSIQCELFIDGIHMAYDILDEDDWCEMAGKRFTDGVRGYRITSRAIANKGITSPGIHGSIRLDIAYFHIDTWVEEDEREATPPPKDKISQAAKDDTEEYTTSLTAGFSSPRKAKVGKVTYYQGDAIQELGSIFIHYRTKGEMNTKRAFDMGSLNHAVSKAQEDQTQEEEGTLSLPVRTKRRPPDDQGGVGERSKRVQQSGPDEDSQ